MESLNPYDVLGVPQDATPERILKAFKALAKVFHPDRPTGNEAKFKQILWAKTLLLDTNKRKTFDSRSTSFASPPRKKRKRGRPKKVPVSAEEEAEDKMTYTQFFTTLFKWPCRNLHKLTDDWLELTFSYYFTFFKIVVEMCPDTGKLHAHLLAQLHKKKRRKQIQKLFGEKCHIEIPANVERCSAYCEPSYMCTNKAKKHFMQTKKDYTHFCGPFGFGEPRRQGQRNELTQLKAQVQAQKSWKGVMNLKCMLDPLVASRYMRWVEKMWAARPKPNLSAWMTLNPFQVTIKTILELVREDDIAQSVNGIMRKHTFVCDEGGSRGKSALVNWFIDCRDALAPHGKMSDILHAWEGQDYFFYDMPRFCQDRDGKSKMEDKFNYFIYLMESFSSGRGFSGKYISQQKRDRAPSQALFCNLSLGTLKLWSQFGGRDWGKFTYDRWNVLVVKDRTIDWYVVNHLYQLQVKHLFVY